jgi:hypothetical protein
MKTRDKTANEARRLPVSTGGESGRRRGTADAEKRATADAEMHNKASPRHHPGGTANRFKRRIQVQISTIKIKKIMAKYLWKVWLRPNVLTPSLTDYVAEVDTAGETRRQQDIIDRIIDEGSEVKRETIKAILDRANTVKRDFILNGYSVYDEFIHLSPRITGTWTGKETFTEGKHKVTVDAVVSKGMHEDFKEVGVHVLGIAEPGAHILLVTDVATQKTDGTITPGDDIVIAGDKIRVIGEPQPDGSLEPGMGVFFVDSTAITPAARITENMPSHVVARVPAGMPDGTYTLRIVTRYTNSVKLLKTPRTIEYNIPLVVKTAP